MAAFDYEAAKAQFGAGRARQMEQEAKTALPPAPTSLPAAPAPAPSGPAGPYNSRGGAPTPAPAPAAAPAPSGLGDLSGFKTYADWQSANRAAGGPGASAQVESYYTGLTGGQAKPGGGTTQYTGPADTTKWRTDVAMTDDAHPDAAGPSGDPFVDQIRNAKHGSEDYARFSNAQLLAWKDKYVPGSNPPKFYNDFGDVVDKPTESGPKSEAAGYATGEKDAGRAAGGGAGGGGGAAPGGGGAAAGAGAAATTSGLPAQMEGVLKDMLSGKNSRYSDSAVQGLLAQIKQRVESSKRNQVRQATEEAAGRGMSRSGRTGTNLAAVRRGAEAEFTSEYGNTLRAKIDADRQDRVDALDRAQRHIDSLRDELYRRDMSAVQRQQFKANLDLAYANLKSQRDALASSQQHSRDMLGAQYGYQATFGG